jgi:hypothetical protein
MSNTGMIDGATGNIVYTTVNPPPAGTTAGAGTFSWSGFTGTTSNGGGYSGGYQPAWNSSTGTFMFGYTQGTVTYTTPVNFALASAGTNIQVNGFRYSWEYINQDYSRGTLTGNINLTNKSGQVVENYNYNMPRTTNGWTLMNGTQNFNTQYAASNLDRLNVSFTGKDDRWWAGYYGPQIRDIDVRLLYSVAPPPVQTDFPKWVPLANEGWDFTVTTTGVVRYGANGTYVYHEFQPGTYSCTNGAWGTDPIGGVYKSCSFGSNTSPTPTPTLPKTTTTTTTTDTYSTGVTLLDPTTTTTTSAGTTDTASTTTQPVTTTTTAVTTTTTTTSAGTTDTSSATSSQPVGSVTASPTIVSAPAPVTTSSSTTTTTSSSSSTSSTTTSSSSKESSGSSGGNVSLALSVISKNSDRDAAGSAVAQSAVAQAQQAGAAAQAEATSVASSAVSNSITAGQSALKSESNGGSTRSSSGSSNGSEYSMQSTGQLNASMAGFTNQSNATAAQKTEQIINASTTTTAAMQSSNNVQIAQPIPVNNTVTNNNTSADTTTVVSVVITTSPQTQTVVQSFMPVQNNTPVQAMVEQQIQVTQQPQVQNIQSESYVLMAPNMLTDKTNPLNDIVEGRQYVPQNTNTTTTGPSVNKDAQDNDAAGGVSINKMATAPTGYADYLNFTMRDVAFYAPKEVYKNQRNVDNARVLRSLTNDNRHREMVEMQYAK